jgi:hypothetical protein
MLIYGVFLVERFFFLGVLRVLGWHSHCLCHIAKAREVVYELVGDVCGFLPADSAVSSLSTPLRTHFINMVSR